MSVMRLLTAVGLLVGFTWFAFSAAPPPHLPIDKWIEELGAEEIEIWQKARDNLWAAGDRALPALRAAKKSPDPDVVLRATVLLSKIEWGIYPDTPAEVVKEIEGYREGDDNGKRAAVTKLTTLGRGGLHALRKLLTMESNAERKREIADLLKTLVRPQARDFIVKGDLDDADRALETAAAGGIEATLDYCAFLLLTGRAKAKAAELESRANDDKAAARTAALLRRAMGDLSTARKLADKSGDEALISNFLDEAEDYKALAKSPPPDLKGSPETMAALYYRAGDKAAFDEEMKKLPKEEYGILATMQFFNGQPRQGIESYTKSQDLVGTTALLITQGRRKEAMELKAPDDDKLGVGGPLQLEQAVLAHRMGDEEKSKKLVEAAMKTITANAEKEAKQGSFNDQPLGARLKAAKKLEKFNEAIDEVAAVLDKVKSGATPSYVLAELGTPRDREAVLLLWQFLRDTKKDTVQSEHLKLLRDWFVARKADKDFEETMTAAKKWEGAGMDRKADWHQALARLYVSLGRGKEAEELYKGLTKDSKNPADFQRLGDFYFDVRRWADAAAAYEEALKLDPTLPAVTYLRGLALTKADNAKEGRSLMDRGRLLALGEESIRYSLAERLTRMGEADEAAEEYLLLVRTAPFRSIYASNASSVLGARAAAKKEYAEAARYFRRMITNVALSRSGVFTDTRAYLIVPGRAHQNEALALIQAGKLDEALAEAKKLWEYLPEETNVVADLVRGLEKGDRKKEADKLFDDTFEKLTKATEESPKMSDVHNRAAWLAARTGRKLKEGIEHAKKATELAPTSAVVFDTLAEVHFQNGDKDEAVAAIKKAVDLAPKVPYYAAQQKRIEAGDKKAELPPR